MDETFQIGKWQKVLVLGSGGFGIVTLWKNVDSDELIAIKKCKFQMSSSLTPKQKERWKKEVEIMKSISHENIVGFKEIPRILHNALLKNNPTKLPLLSMEYCTKGNLRHLLQQHRNVSGLEEHEIRCILKDVLSGLQYLHHLNITHRDIKPENIVLQHTNQRKGNTIYKIIDLGYAKELNDSTVSFVGTFHYLAPEIFETVKYDSSVDYWSMGITTFEIVCGVLPFLPHLTPPQRFADIKRKGPRDICIDLNYSGQTVYSTELKKEILVSSWLKENIEEWLRHVLQFDPIERAKSFSNGETVFDYLCGILSKKVVKVFTLHNFEYYSYEIDESTLVGTLKDWISRDIKISKQAMIVLFRKDFFPPDNQFVLNIMDSEDYVFVINADCLVSYPITYHFPKLVKEVMQSALNFKKNYVLQLFSQSVYYITVERITANLFKCGLQYYVGYLKQTAEKLKERYIFTSRKLGNLLVRIDCCMGIRKNNPAETVLLQNEEFKKCVVCIQNLLENLQENRNHFRGFKTKLDKTFNRMRILITIWPEIVKLVNDYNFAQQYKRIVSLLDNPDHRSDIGLLKREVTDSVSQSIRIKDKLFKHQLFKAYLSGMVFVGKSLQIILPWLLEFDKTIEDISKLYMTHESLYWNIRIKLAKDQPADVQSYSLNRQNSFFLKQFENLSFEGHGILEEISTLS